MIEIQIAPSHTRRSVRYVFFDRRRVIFAIVGLTTLLAALSGAMAAAPAVIRRVYKDTFLHSMRTERDIQRERLHENVQQMSSLERSLEEHRIRVEKLITTYGLDRDLGKGGFSFPGVTSDSTDTQLDDAHRREAGLR